MGAYSSWASLALAHHMLVMVATEGKTKKYAILGDDMTIESKYGEIYRQIVLSLGVNISLAKSLLTSSFIEFAKRLFNSETGEVDAILGPKLVMESIRNRFFKITLLHESYKRGLLDRRGLFEKLANPS